MWRASGQFVPKVQYPGDLCCDLFNDENFEGKSKRYCNDGIGTAMKQWDMIEERFDNKFSSLYCGKNTWYNFCDHGAESC